MRLGPLVILALALAGCSQSATAPASATAVGSPVGSELELPGVLRLPLVSGPPSALEAGTYLTPEGFDPVISITLPEGWFGAASLEEFGVGQGFDEANDNFAGAGLFLATSVLPYDEAVSTFAALPGLTHDQAETTGTVDGHESTTFYAFAPGEHVLLDAIVPGSDITAAASQQIFIDVNGTTIFIKTEVLDEGAEVELQDVIASIEFPDEDS